MNVNITGYKVMISRDAAEIMLQPESGRSVRLRFRADQESQNVDTGTWLDADVEPSLFDSMVDLLRNEKPIRVEWTPDSFMLVTPDWVSVGAQRPASTDEVSDVNFS